MKVPGEVARVLGDVAIASVRPVSGGDICAAYRVELAAGPSAFVKTRADAPAGFFAAEAAGLRELAQFATAGVPVPAVLGVTDAALALEWVEPGRPDPGGAEAFGRALAATHMRASHSVDRSTLGSPDGPALVGFAGSTYGWRAPGFVGSLPLDNTGSKTWPEFYATRRVLPYLRGAVDRRAIAPGDAACVERAVAGLDRLAGPWTPPHLLHGDLWSGNVLWAAEGRVHLVDAAAVHFGHAETDLAMLALFGAPHLDRILGAYDEAAPLAEGWRGRVPLHQLHPVLVHAVLFGGSYGAQAGALARAALAA